MTVSRFLTDTSNQPEAADQVLGHRTVHAILWTPSAAAGRVDYRLRTPKVARGASTVARHTSRGVTKRGSWFLKPVVPPSVAQQECPCRLALLCSPRAKGPSRRWSVSVHGWHGSRRWRCLFDTPPSPASRQRDCRQLPLYPKVLAPSEMHINSQPRPPSSTLGTIKRSAVVTERRHPKRHSADQLLPHRLYPRLRRNSEDSQDTGHVSKPIRLEAPDLHWGIKAGSRLLQHNPRPRCIHIEMPGTFNDDA